MKINVIILYVFSTDALHQDGVRYRGGSTKLLIFLVVLFAVTTVALAVVVAVTLLKLEKDDKCDDKGKITRAIMD